jgi:hypothetical protein
MTAFSLTQPEIIDRLRVNAAIGNRIADGKAKLQTEEQRIAEAMAKLRIEEQKIADAMAKLRVEAQRIADEQMKVSLEEAAHFAKEIKLRTWLHELNENGAITLVALDFDPDGRTIRWGNGCRVKLGSTPCRFVKTLYFAEGQQMTMTDVEEKVWGEGADGTIQTTATNLRKALAENDFPYTVINISNKRWEETETLESDHSNPLPLRPAIAGFALVLA